MGWLNSGGTKLGFLRRETIAGVTGDALQRPRQPRMELHGWNSMWLRAVYPRRADASHRAPVSGAAARAHRLSADVLRRRCHRRAIARGVLRDRFGLATPAAYRRPGTTIYAFPGRLRAWNTIAVDTSDARRAGPLRLRSRQSDSSSRSSQRSSRTSKQHMSGAFAGVHIELQAAADPASALRNVVKGLS